MTNTTLTRYEPFQNDDDGEFVGMKPVPDGEWVKLADVTALADTLDPRQRLPDRREAEGIPVTHIYALGTAGQIEEHMVLRVGRYEDGRVGEVFIDYTDPKMYRNERAKNLGHDIATVLSIALQYGVPIDVLRDAVGRGEAPYLGKMVEYPHTPVGTVLDALWNATAPTDEPFS